MGRIEDKLNEIEEFIEELYEIFPDNLKAYLKSKEKKAACERYFEKIIEAVTDVVFYVIKLKNLTIPQDEESAFDILETNEVISKELCKNLKKAKGMRNIIIHQYGIIDDKLVFNSISEELKKDVKEFIKIIRQQIKSKK